MRSTATPLAAWVHSSPGSKNSLPTSADVASASSAATSWRAAGGRLAAEIDVDVDVGAVVGHAGRRRSTQCHGLNFRVQRETLRQAARDVEVARVDHCHPSAITSRTLGPSSSASVICPSLVQAPRTAVSRSAFHLCLARPPFLSEGRSKMIRHPLTGKGDHALLALQRCWLSRATARRYQSADRASLSAQTRAYHLRSSGGSRLIG